MGELTGTTWDVFTDTRNSRQSSSWRDVCFLTISKVLLQQAKRHSVDLAHHMGNKVSKEIVTEVQHFHVLVVQGDLDRISSLTVLQGAVHQV